MMASPTFGGDDTSETGAVFTNNGTFTVFHASSAPDFEVTPHRFVGLRFEKIISEVPQRLHAPVLPCMPAQAHRRIGKQRSWTGRNYRKAA